MALINYLTRIEFDFGSVSKVAEIARELDIKDPLIVTDKSLVKLGMHRAVADQFGDDVTVFDNSPSIPTEMAILEAHGVYNSSGCDGIIAIGGGSPLDLAKGVRLLSGHDLPLAQYATTGGRQCNEGPLPLYQSAHSDRTGVSGSPQRCMVS